MMKPYWESPETTIYNADCVEVMREFQQDSIDAVITSPPYADLKDYDIGFAVKPKDYPDWFLPIAKEMCRVIKESGSIIVVIDDCFKEGFVDPYVFRTVLHVLENTDLELAQRHYWLKTNAQPDNTHRLKNAIENIFHFVKSPDYHTNKNAIRIESEYQKTDKRAWKYHEDGADPTNVICVKKTQTQKTIHPALYPEALPGRFIPYLTDKGMTILDCFMGSGTTLSVAKKMNRRSIGIDANVDYCEIAKNRVETVQIEMF